MADHLTEEEQIEAIKKWWAENWLYVVLPVVVSVVFYLGFNYWQDKKISDSQAGSEQHELLLQLMRDYGENPSEAKVDEAINLGEKISSDYSSTLYADYANLILARLHIDRQNYSAAEVTLRKVIEAKNQPAAVALAKSRLARVLLNVDKADEALALVSGTTDLSFTSVFAEIRGDVLVYKGDIDAAQTAYQEAIDNLPPELLVRKQYLEQKSMGAKLMSHRPEEVAPESDAQEQTEEASEGAS